MGTTLVALAVTTDVGTVVSHVGDSRCYRVRRGRLVQLTQDHTVVAELVSTGELDGAEAGTHPHRFVLTRAVGVGPHTHVDFAGLACEPGDRLLLCTDGLHKSVPFEELQRTLGASPGDPGDPGALSGELVATAARRGADEDVTALVVVTT